MQNLPKIKEGPESAAASHPGRLRAANEDAFGSISAHHVNAGNFVVCDGMGGSAAGEVASRLTAATMMRALRGIEFSAEKMRQAVTVANRRVYQRAQDDLGLAGMGTTLVALAIRGPYAWLAHIGDSRCYRWRDGVLAALTRDHSVVDEQIRKGQLTREQAELSPMRHIITRAVGTQPQVEAEVAEFEIAAGDLFLLVSDGILRELEEEQIASVLQAHDNLRLACWQLVAEANEAGGRDNVTCVLVRPSTKPI